MKRHSTAVILAMLLVFLGAMPTNGQSLATASHTVTITVLPAVDLDADSFLAFGMPGTHDTDRPLVAETQTSLAVRSTLEDVRVAVGLSEDLPSDIRLRLADDSGNRVPLSTSSTQVLTGSAGSGSVNLTFEAEVDGDWLYVG